MRGLSSAHHRSSRAAPSDSPEPGLSFLSLLLAIETPALPQHQPPGSAAAQGPTGEQTPSRKRVFSRRRPAGQTLWYLAARVRRTPVPCSATNTQSPNPFRAFCLQSQVLALAVA